MEVYEIAAITSSMISTVGKIYSNFIISALFLFIAVVNLQNQIVLLHRGYRAGLPPPYELHPLLVVLVGASAQRWVFAVSSAKGEDGE